MFGSLGIRSEFARNFICQAFRNLRKEQNFLRKLRNFLRKGLFCRLFLAGYFSRPRQQPSAHPVAANAQRKERNPEADTLGKQQLLHALTIAEQQHNGNSPYNAECR